MEAKSVNIRVRYKCRCGLQKTISLFDIEMKGAPLCPTCGEEMDLIVDIKDFSDECEVE